MKVRVGYRLWILSGFWVSKSDAEQRGPAEVTMSEVYFAGRMKLL